MSIEVNVEAPGATFAVTPAHGRRVVFEVRERYRGTSYVVALKGSAGEGFSTHRTFETAFRSAHYRARRYDRAYSKPRGIAQERTAA